MESANTPTRCDCLQDKSADLSTGHFSQAACIDERVVQLDNHIRQLIELRSALLHRSNQLRSPIYTIPSEIISHIFRDVAEFIPDASDWEDTRCRANLQQAFALCSVSRCFRQVALGTPQLWNQLHFKLSSAKQIIKQFVPLIKHCTSHLSGLYLGVKLRFGRDFDVLEEHGRLLTQTLFAPEIAYKIKHLTLRRAPEWMLPACSLPFPVLNTLVVTGSTITELNLDALPLIRVSLDLPDLRSITLPPSVQVLHLDNLTGSPVISILDQECPNPVECSAGHEQGSETRRCSTSRHPISLHYLKEFHWSNRIGLRTIQNLRLPSLEHLHLGSNSLRDPDFVTAVMSLCGQTSSTLISLELMGFADLGDEGLRNICNLKYPHLERLRFHLLTGAILKATKEILLQVEREDINPGVRCMPNLRYLSFSAPSNRYERANPFPPLFLDLLKQKRFGETSHFHFDVNVGRRDQDEELWPEDLREELKSIMSGRRLELTRQGERIKWL